MSASGMGIVRGLAMRLSVDRFGIGLHALFIVAGTRRQGWILVKTRVRASCRPRVRAGFYTDGIMTRVRAWARARNQIIQHVLVREPLAPLELGLELGKGKFGLGFGLGWACYCASARAIRKRLIPYESLKDL
eukprot:244167-Amorphochlora_amoeboformis.AAC.1